MYQLIIVDDEKEIRAGLAQFFPWRRLGFEVAASFSEARSALQYLQERPVDVVVSDVIMPGMDGLEMARLIAETDTARPRPHVILFSAYDRFEYAQRALQYRCTDYVLKSSEFEELIQVFTRLKATMDTERNIQTHREPAAQADAGTAAAGLPLEAASQPYAAKPDLPEDALADQVIHTIVAYITQDPATANLEAAARQVFMSPAYASRYFKQRCGLSFSDYLLHEKMQLAARLLAEPQNKIYEVSQRLGYRDSANFTRAFKSYYQVSPKTYRYRSMGRQTKADRNTRR
ncbi:response regulator [Oscillospiraceae bacterium HV4-5-C5C]|nr:response regulator [Oscillospiraceae bacterium HV4-5-C5C]